MFAMRKLLLYLLRSYCLTVITITMVSFFETTIIILCNNPVDNDTPFSSPILAALICGILYPLYNLPVIVALYKYNFSKLEIIIESICIVIIITCIDNVIGGLFSPNQLWNNTERVWWYSSSFSIVFGILITYILCLLYVGIKQFVVRHKKNRNRERFR